MAKSKITLSISKLIVFICFFCSHNFTLADFFNKDDNILPVEKAFVLDAYLKDNTLKLDFTISSGSYLYKDKIKLKTLNDNIFYAKLPNGTIKKDAHNSYVVLSKNFSINIPVNRDLKGIYITYQGCSKSGYCYMPIVKKININKATNNIAITNESLEAFPPTSDILEDPTNNNYLNSKIAEIFHQNSLFITLLVFLGLGILLTFTPCVLPMAPIVVNMIVTKKEVTSSKRSAVLVGSYVLSMATCYSLAGITIALIGSSIQATLQQPVVLISLSFLIFYFALAQLDITVFRLPQIFKSLTTKKIDQEHGSIISAILMGAISALVVSPCVTPALIGALAYIGQTGDVKLGGLALFCMGLGMGLPLFVMAVLGGKFIPKTGMWMVLIKKITGLLLLFLGVFIISRIIPDNVTLAIYAILLISSPFILDIIPFKTKNLTKIRLFISSLLFIYGGALLMGSIYGGDSLINPIQNFRVQNKASFVVVDNLKSLNKELNKFKEMSKKDNLPALSIIDVYADWCISCKIIDKEIFQNPKIILKLSNANVNLIKFDMTNNTKEVREFLTDYSIIGPPTLIFLKDNKESKDLRVIGETNSHKFVKNLKTLNGN